MKFLITGGAGFIGSALIRHIIRNTNDEVVNVDKLTYAGNLESLASVSSDRRYVFERVDICSRDDVERLFREHLPDAVMHLAAESHVDRSIDSPGAFIETNIVGTYVLLDVARQYYGSVAPRVRESFRFHHVSTDEVYGDRHLLDACNELTAYSPSSPYAASKASADHLVRAWHRTFELPVVVTNCSNNYGPYHFPEKLIPLMILNALEGKPLPVYGQGNQIRDWLFVEDHARALYEVVTRGRLGETYNIGGRNEVANIDVVRAICTLLDELAPHRRPSSLLRFDELIAYVQDRPGHDKRYAIDSSKIATELRWKPIETFETGLRKTVQWYLDNSAWCRRVQDGHYRRERLGLPEVNT